jgi:TonB family protein
LVFAGTNLADGKQALKSGTALTKPSVPLQTQSASPSRVRVAGQLAQRQLLTHFELRDWPHGDILTNTIINLVVTAEGEVLSADLVSGSGLSAADQDALKQAQAARFNSIALSGPGRVEKPLDDLMWGNLVFEWRTLPLPMTNAPQK